MCRGTSRGLRQGRQEREQRGHEVKEQRAKSKEHRADKEGRVEAV
jgi:hypothetical protein